MKLRSLLKDIPNIQIKGSLNPEITGLSSHSKGIKPGELYVAFSGQNFDGRDFIEEALKAKAAGVITDIYNPLLDKKFIQIITRDPRELARALSFRLYQNVRYLLGVTGTNGKTTVSFCVKQLLDLLQVPTGLVGTCLVDTLKKQQDSSLTTPCGISLSKYIHETMQAGGQALISEVSSHALDQKRILGHKFHTVIFTNLTHDHLDYHKTFEAYGEAKLKLFLDEYMPKEGGYAVINIDDPFSSVILKHTKRQVYSYSLLNPEADFFLTELVFDETGFVGTLHHKDKSYRLTSALLGEFNASNILATLISAYIYTKDLEGAIQAISQVKGAPGRLEKVTDNIYIDYAHTPDGLESLLKSLKKLPFKKIRLVFGCGGDRDREKRPIMGKIAETYADEVIVTSDNPRHEEPIKIIEEILQGITKPVKTIVDRKEALELAKSTLEPDTLLIVAGKGHEKTQQIGSIKVAFDETKILLN